MLNTLGGRFGGYGLYVVKGKPPFRFTGKLDKLTIKLVPPTPQQAKLLEQKAQAARNAGQ